MNKFIGLIILVIGFGALFVSPIIGVIIMIIGLVTTWSAEKGK